MISKHAFLAVVFLAGLSALPSRAMACTEAELPGAVKNLGLWANGDDWRQAMTCLGEYGQLATGLLLKELHPVPETDITLGEAETTHKASMHVIWCIRGLRYLTGLNFMAGSAAEIKKQKLPELREYWILFQSGDYVRFYGTWMSRDETFIAPRDIQVAVIKKWKDWYAENGASYTYRTNSDFDAWFF